MARERAHSIFDASTVLFDENCVAEQRVSIPLANFVVLEFNDDCQRPSMGMTSSPTTLPCHGEEKDLFTVSFQQGEITTAGAVESSEPEQLRVIPTQAKGYLLGPTRDVRSIRYGPVCLDRLTPPRWPSSFRQLLKNARKKPVPK